MSLDDMHDALNLLDDDMVEAVDALRYNRKKRKVHWARWISLAACLCIGVISLYGAGRLFATQNDGATECVGAGKETENEMFYGDQEDGNAGETVIYGAGIDITSSSVLLEVQEVKTHGFTGRVTESGETDDFAQGDVLSVAFGEEIDAESQEKLQAGDRVLVSYSLKASGEKQIVARKITWTESEE